MLSILASAPALVTLLLSGSAPFGNLRALDRLVLPQPTLVTVNVSQCAHLKVLEIVSPVLQSVYASGCPSLQVSRYIALGCSGTKHGCPGQVKCV